MPVFPGEITKQPPDSMTEQCLTFIELLIYLEAYFPKRWFNSFSQILVKGCLLEIYDQSLKFDNMKVCNNNLMLKCVVVFICS